MHEVLHWMVNKQWTATKELRTPHCYVKEDEDDKLPSVESDSCTMTPSPYFVRRLFERASVTHLCSEHADHCLRKMLVELDE